MASKNTPSRVRRIPLPSSDEDFWAAVGAQQVIEGSSILSWKQAGTPATERPGGIGGSTRTKNKGRGGAAAAYGNDALWCALCDDKTEGRWLTRCKGAGGNGSRQQQTCSIWVHPACAWQNEGYAMRCIAGSTGSSESETRVPTVFFACLQHDKPATYCSCKREEGDNKEEAEDYIECESCNEWYHFSCEGLDEADPPDVYNCKRCRQLTAKGQKVSAQERRRNKAKTNEYMSQMLANKVMNIQQWMKEVKTLAGVSRLNAPANPAERAEEQAAVQGRYATLKELLARREELEAPLEDEESEEEEMPTSARGRGKKGAKGKAKKGNARSNSGGGDGGDGGGTADESKIIAGMEGVYAVTSATLEEVDDEAEAMETAVDTWFDEHTEPYYKKSDGGGRLGYWNTSVAALEGEVAELEALVETARSARAVSPAAVAVADDALAAARWALRAVRLFAGGGGGSGSSGGVSAARLKAAGGEEMVRAAGGERWGLPMLAEVSTLLDTAEEAMTTSADRRGRANSAWEHLDEIRSMATQWIRRAKTCLRSDGAAAGVTLAVMRRHLSSGDAIPVVMPEYQELERVAFEWEAWEARALRRVAALEAVPLEELADTTTISGETDAEGSQLLREAEAFAYGVKTSARDALVRALGRRGWAQRACAVVSSSSAGIARPGVALAKSLMTEAGKLGLLKSYSGSGAGLIGRVRGLAEGEGPVKRARELLVAPANGGLGEHSLELELSEAEGVLDALRSSPVVYPEEETLALRLDALRWNEAAAKGLAEFIPYPQLLHLHEQITTSAQLEAVVEGFKTCMPLYTKVSKVKRWQERAQKLLEAVRGAVAAGAAATDGGGVGIAGEAGSLRQLVEACLSELQADLKVSDVPEAVELSDFLQEVRAWEQEVARVSMSGMSSTAEELLRLASAGQRVITLPQVVEALRWRAECLRVARGGHGVDAEGVAALVAAGDALSQWSKAAPAVASVESSGGAENGGGGGVDGSYQRLVMDLTAAGQGDLGWHSWRARASRAATVPRVTPGSSGVDSSPAPKVTLAEARALLNAASPSTVDGIGNSSSGGDGRAGTSAAVAPLRGDALRLATASRELAALRAAVEAKDAAIKLALGGRRGRGVGGGDRGWGSEFAAAPPTKWREAVALGRRGEGATAGPRREWEAWVASVTGLVEGMAGLLAGLVGVAPSLESSLERHLEMRIKAGRWLVVAGRYVFFTAIGMNGQRSLPTLSSLETLLDTAPSKTPPYTPAEDAVASEEGREGGKVGGRSERAVVVSLLGRVTDLRDAAVAWATEASALLSRLGGEARGGARAVAGVKDSARCIEALLAQDVVHAIQMPEEKALRKALLEQGQWKPKVISLLSAPLTQAPAALGASRESDPGAWLARARDLLQRAPPPMPTPTLAGSAHMALLKWAITVMEMADAVRAAAAGSKAAPNFGNRPKLVEMEPLADQGRALLASSSSSTSTGGGATAAGSETADLLAAVGIAAPQGVAPAAIPSQATEHLHLRLSDGPLFAVTAVSAVVRGVYACRRWVEGAKALTSRRGLDGASAATLVRELQANRQLPYAVGGTLRTTLAHELSLKAPDNPELAHHLGSVNCDEDDEMAGALDINDMDWVGEGLGGMSGTIDVVTVSPVKTPKHATVDLAASPAAPAPATGFMRNGTASVVAPAVTPALTRTSALSRAAAAKPPPPLFAGSSAGRTRGSRNQRASPFNLKACSACKKDRASPIKCRVDRRHWEDPDWTDPPTRAWVMPPGFVEWLAKSESGAGGQQPGKLIANAAIAAAAIGAKNPSRAAASSSFKSQGPRRVPGPETASSLLDRMLGSAALPPRAPAPVVPSVVPAPRVAPGGPLAGGVGIKRPRCLAPGCMNAVARDAPFCSDDCVVNAQRQAVQALVSSRGQLRASRAPLPPRASAARGASRSGAGTGAGAGGAAAAVASTTNNGSAGGDAATVGDGGAGGTGAGGGGGSTVGAAGASASSASAPGAWTPQDEEEFAKGLEAVRGRSAQNATQRFRNKVMDRFRELFAEGINELGVDSMDVAVFSGVLAWDLEHELNAFSRSDRGVYKEKAQSLRFNIKFAKNPELFKDLLTGGTSMKTLCGMTTDELASSHLKEERKRIRDESYAGHLRQEDEGNEIVYKDGALQKIAKVKSEAKKQGLAVTAASITGGNTASITGSNTAITGTDTALTTGAKKARRSGTGSSPSTGSGSSGVGGGAGVVVKMDEEVEGGSGGGQGSEGGGGAGKKPGVGASVEGGGGEEEGDEEGEEEEEEDEGVQVGVGGTSERLGAPDLKRRLSGSSDVGVDGEEVGGGIETAKRIKMLSVGSPIIDDVPKFEFPSSPLPTIPSAPNLDVPPVPSPPGPEDDSDDDDMSDLRGRPAEVDSDESDSTGRVGHGDSGDSVGSVGSKRDQDGVNGRAGDEDRSSADKLESGSPVDDTDMDLDDDDDDEPPSMSSSFDWSKSSGAAAAGAGEGEGASGVGSRMANPPPEKIEGMTHIIPKPGRGGRPVKGGNFAINEPGREPFYVYAYHAGTPDQCADLQRLLPRNVDVDGRVAIGNLNGTMKSRQEGSVRVLVLRPGGGGPNNPNVCSRFCNDFATYKNQGRAGYCFKQFDKKHVEFLYLLPPALAHQVPLLAQYPAAYGHLVCLVVTIHGSGREPSGAPATGANRPTAVPAAQAQALPPPPTPHLHQHFKQQQQQQQHQQQPQYLQHPPHGTFPPTASTAPPAQQVIQPRPQQRQQHPAPPGPPPRTRLVGGSALPPPPPPPPHSPALPGTPTASVTQMMWNAPPHVDQAVGPAGPPAAAPEVAPAPLQHAVAPAPSQGHLQSRPPPPPPPPPPRAAQAAFGVEGATQAYQAPPPPPKQQHPSRQQHPQEQQQQQVQQQVHQQHPLARPIAERIVAMGPQELEAMRMLPDARTQYPFIFDGHPGFGAFRDTLATLVMPRLQQGAGDSAGT